MPKVKAKKRVTKSVKTKPVHVVFILDETGSMLRVKDSTISGFNEYLETLQNDKNANTHKMSFLTFNSRGVRRRELFTNLKAVEKLNHQSYNPAANTPLYDAIGEGLAGIDLDSKHDILVVIQTDGEENSSVRETRDSIFRKIEEAKKAGWGFVFLGADQDAWGAAQLIGIPRGSTMSYDNTAQGIQGAMTDTERATVRYMNSTAEQRNQLRASFLSGDENQGLDLRRDVNAPNS